MMSKLAFIISNRIGLRTLLKSLIVYSRGKAHKNGRGLGALLINGNSLLYLGKNISIINKGTFSLGARMPRGFLVSRKPCALEMNENSKLVVNGFVTTGSGVIISLGRNAVLEIGNDVSINSDSKLICYTNMKIGDGSTISWEVEIRDCDFHKIVRDDFVVSKPIEIGSNVWIGSRATVLKGVKIGNGAMIATGSVVTKDVPENCLVAGVPSRVIRRNIKWER
jgi:acetyltransferase-like isoleucine patch superfamily enzyme